VSDRRDDWGEIMRYSRRNDRRVPAPGTQGPPRLDPVLGTWFNCDARTGEVARLELTERGGRLGLRAFGADEPSPVDWGETPAEPNVQSLDSREVTGFTAEYDFGFMETRIAANIKYGVLVIQSYNRFRDDSGRPCYLTREFFHQLIPPDGAPSEVPSLATADVPPPGAEAPGVAVDLGPLLGRWRNTYRNSQGIARVVLSRDREGDWVEGTVVGRGEPWGRVPAVPYAAHVAGREAVGFLSRIDLGSARWVLSANEAKGLLIIASFTSFRDESRRSPYFTREFFYREGDRADAAS
jgi:hypothetical protein